jgi:uncharacterized protein (TIGR02448 family)
MKMIVIATLVLAGVSAQATEISQIYTESASSTVDFTLAIPLVTSGGVIYTSASISGETYKLIVAAKEDTAVYLASEGQVRAAGFSAAIEALRNENPALSASDLDVAQAMLKL